MAKKEEPSYKQLAIIFAVCIVAIIAIVSAANSADRNIGGDAVITPEKTCEKEEYCVAWEWVEVKESVCNKYEFSKYKECDRYSWPVDENGYPVMQCDSWNIYYKNMCVEWSEEGKWHRQCTDWRTKHECEIAT